MKIIITSLIKDLFTTVSLLLLISGCNSNSDHQSQVDVDSAQLQTALRVHIEFLADDYLKGRNTGSDEYEIAARYVQSHFKQFGLKAAGENGGWFQRVPFVKTTLVEGSAEMTLHTKDGDIDFNFPDEFLTSGSSISDADEIKGEVVFVGYGIVSKELKHNDYAGLDVKGKIVAYLTSKPTSFPSEVGAHVSSGSEKHRYAAEHGAIGILQLHTNLRDKVRTYERIKPYAAKPSMAWKMKDGSAFGTYKNLKGSAYLSKSTGKKMFSAAGYDLNAIFEEQDAGKVPVGFNLGIEVSLKRKSEHEAILSSNVAGILEGSDVHLKNEYIVYTAHLDHLGVKRPSSTETNADEDLINNGALDNASGVSIMLETARMFSQGKRPKRSILFVAVTGEENGLLGSNYFAHYPTVPLSSMIADINLDMPMILYPFADVVAFGAQHSSMGAYVEKAAAMFNLKLSPDPMPEQAIFVRSDHYSFVKQGVPSIFLMPGFNSTDPNVDGGAVFHKFFEEHYHQPSDATTLPINYESGALFTKVNFQIGSEIANAKDNERPHWNEKDYFGDTFRQ